MVHAVSATYVRFEHMSPPAMGLAVLLHASVVVALWMVPLKTDDPTPAPIEVTIEQPAPEPKVEPAPPVASPPVAPPVEAAPPAPLPPPAPPPVRAQPLPSPALSRPLTLGPPPPAPEVAEKRTEPQQKPKEDDTPPTPEHEPPPQQVAATAPPPPPPPPAPTLEQVLPPIDAPPAPVTSLDFPKPAAPPAPPPPKPTPPPVRQAAPQQHPPSPQQNPQLRPSPLTEHSRPPAGSQATAPPSSRFVNPADQAHRNRVADQYIWQVIRRFGQFFPDLRVKNEEGTVVLRLVVARDGRLIESGIAKSSGSPILDRAMLDTARAAAPYGPMPPELGERMTFNVPIQSKYR